MKIKKFFGGGIAYLPTVNRDYEEAVTTAASSDSSKKKPVDKLYDIIKEAGLDSDVAVFTQSILAQLDMAGDPDGETLTQRDLVRFAQKASSVKTNYERYKTAVTNLTSQNAEYDVAINDRGFIYCYTKDGKVDTISRQTYKENTDKYTALTNAELLDLRRKSTSLAYDTKIIDDINNAVGTDTIVKYLQDSISKFNSSTVQGYSAKDQNDIQSGMQALIGGQFNRKILADIVAGPDGVYKIKNSETIVDQHIDEALRFLIQTLPNKMRRKLEAMATVEGYEPSAMMLTMLVANTERELSADWEGQIDEDGMLSKKGAAEKDETKYYKDDTLAARFARGDLKQTRAFVAPAAEMAGDTALMSLDAWNGYRPVTDDLKAIQNTNVYDAFNYITQLKGCDQSSITFGDTRVNRNDLHGMILDENKNVTRMALPFKYDSDGAIVPDFDLLKKYNKVNRLVQENPGMAKAEIRQRLGQELGDVIIDENGRVTIRPDRIALFGCLGVIASKELIDIDFGENKFIQRLDKAYGEGIKDEFNKLVQFGTTKISKGQKPLYDLDDSGKDDFYMGWLYMPITDPTQGFGLTQNQLIEREDLMDVTKKETISEIVNQNSRRNSMRTRME